MTARPRGDAPQYRVLGARITVLDRDDWFATLAEGIRSRCRTVMVSQNLHGTYLRRRDDQLALLQEEADAVRIDGLPLVAWSRLLGLPVRREHRAGFMDLLPELMARAADEGWRVAFVGGKPGVAERAAERLRAQHPGLQLTALHGYFPMEDGAPELEERLAAIEAARADLLLVGMGMPRQERFVLRFRDRIAAPVILTCGAAFDYVAGELPMAPRWLSRAGLEWAFRLAAQPRALWRRYLFEPLTLVPAMATDLARRARGRTAFTWTPREEGRR